MEYDVAVVGGGIVGLAHAWSAARRGLRVAVFERHARAMGATVRNFGMIWPIGQTPGEAHEIALRSARLWRHLASHAHFWLQPVGSLHLAHRPDEWQVLQEFAALAPSLGYPGSLLDPDETQRLSAAVNPSGLHGSWLSDTEMAVNPRTAAQQISSWLASRWKVDFHFRTAIAHVDAGALQAANGQRWRASRVVVCSGADFETLFPDILAESGLIACKLQMLQTVAQPNGWRLGPHLASGLTLRHYRNFDICPGIAALRKRIADETPELDQFGIHVMASQLETGEVILGDSHEYGDEIEPFDKSLIDQLMLRELRAIIRLPEWQIQQRWNGVYAKHPRQTIFRADPREQVHIRTGTGGAGMTLSFGLADQEWDSWVGPADE